MKMAFKHNLAFDNQQAEGRGLVECHKLLLNCMFVVFLNADLIFTISYLVKNKLIKWCPKSKKTWGILQIIRCFRQAAAV